jgi:RNA polymerase sigma-70 factor (ECF subfamily)
VSGSHRPEGAGNPVFATTHWSVVVAAGDGSNPSAEAALASLCQTYWFPLYAHIRRRGHDPENARDLTQGLFLALLSRDGIARARQEKGRFRSFLMKAADNHLHEAHRNAETLKRGRGQEIVSFDATEAEQRFALEPRDERAPDSEYDRRWALATLDRVRQRLRAEFSSGGRIELFDLLRPHLFGDVETIPYAEIARTTQLSLVAIKQTTFRLRRRFGELLRVEVGQTLANPADTDQELRHLLAALRGP